LEGKYDLCIWSYSYLYFDSAEEKAAEREEESDYISVPDNYGVSTWYHISDEPLYAKSYYVFGKISKIMNNTRCSFINKIKRQAASFFIVPLC
jgi:hypothetical protein